jgi:glycosyltransferase involved in cell wall biosynthesis
MGREGVKMSCLASLIITSFQRAHLLKWGLDSLVKQKVPFELETIVVNDGLPDETESVCRRYREKLSIRYLFSGQRNLGGRLKWRVPGFAVNIGAKYARGSVLLISCAEMYHLSNTISQLTGPLLTNHRQITIPIGKDDRDGAFLHLLNHPDAGVFDLQAFLNYPDLNTYLPFLIGVWREYFLEIGGYDEDFTGMAFDDNDLVDRLQAFGCRFLKTDALTMHLYHPRRMDQVGMGPEWQYNQNLYLSRRGIIRRNQHRSWGVL